VHGAELPLLLEAWGALTGEGRLPAAFELSGRTDLLTSVFPVVDLAAAAIGTSLLGASVLEAARSGRAPGPVALDAAHVACAVRSERYARIDGEPAGSGFAPLSRFVRTADGWIRLHTNYPWHRERLLRVLGAPDEPDAVAAAASRWSALELEEAIVNAGGCAAAVRRPQEWAAHPQGVAVNGLPLVELRPAQDGAERPVGDTAAGLPPPPLGRSGPASGVRVLDLTRVIAGPVCTRTLAAHGAEVLRIDSPDMPENPRHTLDVLAGKRSALLDFRTPEGRRRLDELVAGADVVVQGYRPGALARFGLRPDELSRRHPSLVVLSLSAWGRVGPWAGRRGFDSLVQPATGIAVCEAAGEEVPGALPAQLLDHATGYLAAAAVLVALARRHREGRGWHGHVSLAQTAAWVLRQPPRPKAPRPEPDATPYLVDMDAPVGAVTIVNPPGRLGGRPLAWPRPPARFGADAPRWQ
jgi:crotonobetainyl-CoA:carnitine CoA-transferase CaiB-like acyl-CoA transferase